MARGGHRQPRQPAAVSGPGALSQRTDGGVQPIRVASGQPYGARKALEQMQRSAPVPEAPGPAGAVSPASPAPAGPASLFDAPPTNPLATLHSPQGAARPSVIVQDDPYALLRKLYQVYPHPDIARLIDDGD